MSDSDSIFLPPKRPTITNSAEWHITARLVRDGQTLEESTAPLVISDSWFNDRYETKGETKGRYNGRLHLAGLNIGRWVEDLAQKRARRENAQRRAGKKR